MALFERLKDKICPEFFTKETRFEVTNRCVKEKGAGKSLRAKNRNFQGAWKNLQERKEEDRT